MQIYERDNELIVIHKIEKIRMVKNDDGTYWICISLQSGEINCFSYKNQWQQENHYQTLKSSILDYLNPPVYAKDLYPGFKEKD